MARCWQKPNSARAELMSFTNSVFPLKEANESRYWLKLLLASSYIPQPKFNDLDHSCNEIISMLVASINTLKA